MRSKKIPRRSSSFRVGNVHHLIKGLCIMDMQTQLFEAALGIENPIFIERREFERSSGELHIYTDFKRGSSFHVLSAAKSVAKFTAQLRKLRGT